MKRERKNIEIFVYGTLMTGYPLHDWLKNDVFRSAEAKVKGRLYPFGDGGYPVAYIAHYEHEQESIKSYVHGEILTVKLSDTVMECIQMEARAGYQPRWTEAILLSGRQVPAMTFHFQDTNSSFVGPEIVTGRWSDYVRCQSISSQILSNQWLRKRIIKVLATEIDGTDNDAEQDLQLMLFNSSQTDYLIKLAKDANEFKLEP